MAGQPGLFDLDERYAALSRTGDPLERLAAVVDFEIFRSDLDAALARSDGSKGGRPPMDAVMMFKVLVLQALYGLADEQTEFQIRDRLSFMVSLRRRPSDGVSASVLSPTLWPTISSDPRLNSFLPRMACDGGTGAMRTRSGSWRRAFGDTGKCRRRPVGMEWHALC